MTKKPEFQQVLNKVKESLIFLSPTVKRGLERECDKSDFYRCGETIKYLYFQKNYMKIK